MSKLSTSAARLSCLSRAYSRVLFTCAPFTASPSPHSGKGMATGASATVSTPGNTLETLHFVNGAIKSLPVEDNRDNYVRTVQGNTKFQLVS